MRTLGVTTIEILGLSAVAAVVSVIGSLVALYLKEFLLARSFERWKERRALLAAFRTYRDPLLLASRELRTRAGAIAKGTPPRIKTAALRNSARLLEMNSASDPHYERYKVISTVYRLCAFLGWLELYRQDVVFLDTGRDATNRALEACLLELRSDMAEGRLNTAPDWYQWKDRLIFKEELRAIGENMITVRDGSRTVVGYASFYSYFDTEDNPDQQRPWWLDVAVQFVADVDGVRDFRVERLKRLEAHLAVLEGLLAAGPRA